LQDEADEWVKLIKQAINIRSPFENLDTSSSSSSSSSTKATEDGAAGGAAVGRAISSSANMEIDETPEAEGEGKADVVNTSNTGAAAGGGAGGETGGKTGGNGGGMSTASWNKWTVPAGYENELEKMITDLKMHIHSKDGENDWMSTGTSSRIATFAMKNAKVRKRRRKRRWKRRWKRREKGGRERRRVCVCVCVCVRHCVSHVCCLLRAVADPVSPSPSLVLPLLSPSLTQVAACKGVGVIDAPPQAVVDLLKEVDRKSSYDTL
jgi:hypothetical protein